MKQRCSRTLGVGLSALLGLAPCGGLAGDEPKQTPANTIAVQLDSPVKPQTFSRPIKFYVRDTIDRSGDPQPMLVLRGRGGVFLDREPRLIVREALEESLRAAGLLAPDEGSADFLLTVYVFHFGLGSGSGMEFFSKVELNIVVKDRRGGKSSEVPAVGTSIEGFAIRKKNLMQNVKANLLEALASALRNFLRGNKLREVVEAGTRTAATRSRNLGIPPSSGKTNEGGAPAGRLSLGEALFDVFGDSPG